MIHLASSCMYETRLHINHGGCRVQNASLELFWRSPLLSSESLFHALLALWTSRTSSHSSSDALSHSFTQAILLVTYQVLLAL